MVKEDAIAGEHIVCLTIVDRDPVGIEFSYTIRVFSSDGIW